MGEPIYLSDAFILQLHSFANSQPSYSVFKETVESTQQRKTRSISAETREYLLNSTVKLGNIVVGKLKFSHCRLCHFKENLQVWTFSIRELNFAPNGHSLNRINRVATGPGLFR